MRKKLYGCLLKYLYSKLRETNQFQSEFEIYFKSAIAISNKILHTFKMNYSS